MIGEHFNVLIVDGDPDARRRERAACRQGGVHWSCVEATGCDAAENLLKSTPIDCVLWNCERMDGDSLQYLNHLRRQCPEVPIIVSARQGNEMVVREAFKSGVVDYLPRSEMHRLSLHDVIARAIDEAAQRRAWEEQRQELERFAHVLAHDLLAPAVHISNFVDILTMDANEGRLDRVSEVLPQLRRSATNLITMIKTLSDYTGVGGELTFSEVSLEEAARNAVEVLREELALKRATVNIGPLPVVRGNLALLSQLFQNLLANGIKFNESDAPTVDISSREAEGCWQIVVHDNGIGIPADRAREIFQPFKRLHGKHAYPGTGLGLSTVQRIAKRHSGRVWLEPSGSGSTFVLELPAAETRFESA